MVVPNNNMSSRIRRADVHDSHHGWFFTRRSDIIIIPSAIVILFLIIYFLLRVIIAVDHRTASRSTSSSHYSSFRPKTSSHREHEHEQEQEYNIPYNNVNDMKVLYIVTSSKEFNTGDKATQKGQDRFMEIVIPAIMESVTSMTRTFAQVDVYLILGYTLSKSRHEYLQNLLPYNVGLQIWNDAIPYGYDYMTHTQQYPYLTVRDKLLARQHRYVIKDKLPYYNMFVVFEDDMLLKNHHVLYHLEFLNEIQKYKEEMLLQKQQQEQQPSGIVRNDKESFWGPLTIDQLDHIKPGFLRVEVLTNHSSTSNLLRQLPEPPTTTNNINDDVDPSYCCHSQYIGHQGRLAPQYPTSNEIALWETSIDGIHVRQMPKLSKSKSSKSSSSKPLLDWVAVLPIKGEPLSMPAYWSGKADLVSSSTSSGDQTTKQKKRPSSVLNEYIGQSAGWMATQHEILDYNYKLCKGKGSSFLPPFESSYIKDDGYSFATDSVEFWSGGLQLWGQQCSIQRLIAIDNNNPSRNQASSSSLLFSKHFIYHTANNKQKELPSTRFTKLSTFYDQIQQVVHAAKQEQKQKLGYYSFFWDYFVG